MAHAPCVLLCRFTMGVLSRDESARLVPLPGLCRSLWAHAGETRLALRRLPDECGM